MGVAVVDCVKIGSAAKTVEGQIELTKNKPRTNLLMIFFMRVILLVSSMLLSLLAGRTGQEATFYKTEDYPIFSILQGFR